ncbi:hypothetical protein ACIBHX_50040 [Nonomuraea sp. NPDC050536]|uniref:hypothetical protein n=1 Tax=Nonomuraea sp. NPDC050536 TaxID=3364366 RepID=UPI0037C987FE
MTRWKLAAASGALALAAGCGGSSGATLTGHTPAVSGSEDPDGQVITSVTEQGAGPKAASPSPLPSPTASRKPQPRDLSGGVTTPPQNKYEEAADQAVARGMTVWVEADLRKQWQAGPAAFEAAIAKIKGIAQRKGVAGVKIADELGYNDGMDSPAQIKAFLADSARALRKAVPDTQIMVDFYVPTLGCQPGSVHPKAVSCAEAANWKYPQISLGNVDYYLAGGNIDVLNLSTAIQTDDVYRAWGTTRAITQRAAWTEVSARRWAYYVTIFARRGLAHPGAFDGDRARAEDLGSVFIDIPKSFGVGATDVWTWRQAYKNDTYRLMDPGMKSNPLWDALLARRKAGDRLMTHFTPSSVERSVPEDLSVLSTVFTDVLIAAGTG